MRSTSLAFLTLIGLLCLPLSSHAAQDFGDFFAPDPSLLALAGASEPLSAPELAELGLRASGVAESQIGPRLEKMQGLFSDLGKFLRDQGIRGQAAKAESVLTWLHKNVFTSYSEGATTIDLILDTGRFNCVSSAVFYLAALRSQGILASGIKTKDHAFAIVSVEGRQIDVETTNPYGFDPGTKKEFSGAFGAATGYAYTPPGNYADRSPINEKQLLALILSNRIASLELAGRYPEALPLGLSFSLLYGGQEGRKILLDCVENLAARLASSQDYAGIESLATTAEGAVGSDPRLTALKAKSAFNRLSILGNRGDWQASRKGAMEAYRAGLLDKAAFEALVTNATGMEAQAMMNRADWQGARALAEEGLASGGLKTGVYESLVVNSYGLEAQALGNKGDWLAAAALAEAGAARLHGNPSLLSTAAMFRQNFVVARHNGFAALYNKGDYAGAVKLLEDALRQLPGNKGLMSDLETARKALAAKR